MVFLFDGSFSGLLTCVFEAFDRKKIDVCIYTESYFQPDLLTPFEKIESDNTKAERVLKGLESKIGNKNTRIFYEAYLSEIPDIYNSIYKIIVRIFKGEITILSNFGDDDVLKISQTLKKVSRERHRMKAFIRFQKDNNGLYFALVEPDFNVLPLIEEFFRKRYADQDWLIYDVKRNYGLLFSQGKTQEVSLENTPTLSKTPSLNIKLEDQDELYQHLWKQYFKSTNIEARKNLKLHLQHVPKRYWKYLTEKQ